MPSSTLRFTFLGVGSGLSPELGNNNVLVESDSGHLLIDCGPVTGADLKMSGRLPAIRHALVTHVHDDHVGGLGLWGQLNRYVYRHRPALHFHESLWDELWEGALRGSLGRVETSDCGAGRAELADYFAPVVHAGLGPIEVPGLPPVTLKPTLHIHGKPCYSLFLGETIYFSADTQELPPAVGPTGKPLSAIFQDCQLFEFEQNVHTPIQRLDREMPPELKRITRLMHYNEEPTAFDAAAMGFAGFVRRGEPIELAL